MVLLPFFLLLCNLVYSHVLPSYFHSTHEVDTEINRLLQQCPYAVKEQQSSNPNIYTLTFNKPSHHHKKNAFIIFGEHARELISVETGLKLVKTLCSSQHDTQITQVLAHYKIVMIVNMNPNSRKYVEIGRFCLRENHNGVDLNRNYDVKWVHVEDHKLQISSGNMPFSEVETQIVRDIFRQLNPEVFISVHSGTLAILQPYAYKPQRCEGRHIFETARRVKQQYCQECIVGSAAEEIGYTASGASQDYAFDVAQAKYSYTLEIYSSETIPTTNRRRHHLIHHKLKHRKQSLIQTVQAREEPESNFAEFLQNKDKEEVSQFEQICFMFFNPQSQDSYNHSVHVWSRAILGILEEVKHLEQQ